MLTEDLFDSILINPALEEEVDELRILSAFSDYGLASTQLEKLRSKKKSIKIHLTLGWRSNIRQAKKSALMSLMNQFPDQFKCTYYDGDLNIHSKVYVWLKDGEPKKAFHGSANYSATAFNYEKQRNTMEECSATEAQEYIDSFRGKYKSLEVLRITQQSALHPQEIETSSVGDSLQDNTVVLSFLATTGPRKGKTHKNDGLNWGMPDGTSRRPFSETKRAGWDEAVIPVRKEIHNNFPGFFPDTKQHFFIETDDEKLFVGVIAQSGRKAIQTPKYTNQNNAWLGRYFRSRIGVPLGERVELEHLEQYGRTDVDIKRVSEDYFELDFSVQK